jgi:uncharacterized protein (TIGR03067 family)
MKRIFICAAVALATVVVAAARAEDKEAVKKDSEQLQGEWSMLSPDGSGETIPDSKRVCKGDETTVTFGGQLMMKAKFTLDPSKKPTTIDYSVTDGLNNGKTLLGIYELDGDTVKFCFSAPGKDRPTDFTAKPGDGRISSVWKRVKKQ